MKIIIIIGSIIVVLAVLFTLTNRGEDFIKNYPSQGETIIAFGDSLVEGVGASKGFDFVSVLSEMIGEPIKNLGVARDTTKQGLARLDAVLEDDPKVVLILLGGNDFIQRVPKEEIFDNLALMIEVIQKEGAIVLLLGIRGGIIRDNYDKEFKKLAKEYETAYVSNVLNGLYGNREFMSDGIHPNDKGYQMIADRIYPVLKELIK